MRIQAQHANLAGVRRAGSPRRSRPWWSCRRRSGRAGRAISPRRTVSDNPSTARAPAVALDEAPDLDRGVTHATSVGRRRTSRAGDRGAAAALPHASHRDRPVPPRPSAGRRVLRARRCRWRRLSTSVSARPHVDCAAGDGFWPWRGPKRHHRPRPFHRCRAARSRRPLQPGGVAASQSACRGWFQPVGALRSRPCAQGVGKADEALEPLGACPALVPDSVPVALACAGALADFFALGRRWNCWMRFCLVFGA